MPSGPHRAETYATLSALLWLDHEVLDRLLFCLTQLQVVLSGGDGRWLGSADGDVRAALDELHLSEVLRAAEVEAVAGSTSPPVTLRELAAAAPQPWQLMLDEHRAALLRLLAEVDSAVTTTSRLLRRPAGRRSGDGAVTQWSEAVRLTCDDVRQESLLAFLR